MSGTPYAEVIGDPIAQSKSPLIHKFWLDALGISGDYRRAHIKADALAAFAADRRDAMLAAGEPVLRPSQRKAPTRMV